MLATSAPGLTCAGVFCVLIAGKQKLRTRAAPSSAPKWEETFIVYDLKSVISQILICADLVTGCAKSKFLCGERYICIATAQHAMQTCSALQDTFSVDDFLGEVVLPVENIRPADALLRFPLNQRQGQVGIVSGRQRHGALQKIFTLCPGELIIRIRKAEGAPLPPQHDLPPETVQELTKRCMAALKEAENVELKTLEYKTIKRSTGTWEYFYPTK
jgi:hypothetical protein